MKAKVKSPSECPVNSISPTREYDNIESSTASKR
jgi:hypothetical protein